LISFLIDIALLGTVVFCGWRGYKNGLIRGVFGVVSLVLALFVANFAAQAYSDDAEVLLLPFASGMLESTMNELSDEGIEYQAIAHDHEVSDDFFGRAYMALREIGFPEAAAVAIAEQSRLVELYGDSDRSFVDIVAEKLTGSLAFVGVFAVAFLLISIVFAVIGNLIGLVFSLPGLRFVDIIAGAICGVAKGIIIVYVLAVIVRYFGLVMLPILEDTAVLYFLVSNNPIANMLGV